MVGTILQSVVQPWLPWSGLYAHCSSGVPKLKADFPERVLVLTGHMPGDYVGALIFLRELKKRGINVVSVGFPELI